jgi:hypothetical protein
MGEPAKRVPLFAKVSPACRDKLDAAAVRLKMSRATVIEVLADYADSIPAAAVDPSRLPADHRGRRGQGRRKKPT